MAENEGCACSSGPKLIFACSGAADVGEITDVSARILSRNGVGKMFCLAGVGGRVGPIMMSTESASQILALDGCGLDCVKHTLEMAGFCNYQHVRVTDLGLEKGKTPVNENAINKVVHRAVELLG
ncbi:MAG: putative zinc-binding protein [Sedimentisphaerales bacterium]|nr:putative zinc-binding protein [Sedimentisphaerales bacterium]